MTWWLCAAGVRLRNQVNSLYPKRDHESDGSVGDTAHAARHSDHNPDPMSNPPGVVRAIDIDRDLDPADPQAIHRLVSDLVTQKDERIFYVIFEKVIYSRVRDFKPRAYTGPNAHLHHAHVSFTAAGDHDAQPFNLPSLGAVT